MAYSSPHDSLDVLCGLLYLLTLPHMVFWMLYAALYAVVRPYASLDLQTKLRKPSNPS